MFNIMHTVGHAATVHGAWAVICFNEKEGGGGGWEKWLRNFSDHNFFQLQYVQYSFWFAPCLFIGELLCMIIAQFLLYRSL